MMRASRENRTTRLLREEFRGLCRRQAGCGEGEEGGELLEGFVEGLSLAQKTDCHDLSFC